MSQLMGEGELSEICDLIENVIDNDPYRVFGTNEVFIS